MPSPAELSEIPVMTPEMRLSVRARGDERAKLVKHFGFGKESFYGDDDKERPPRSYIIAGRAKSLELYDAVHNLFDVYEESYVNNLGLVVLNAAGVSQPLNFTAGPVGIGNFQNGELTINSGLWRRSYRFSDALALPKPDESKNHKDFYVRLARTLTPLIGNKPAKVYITNANPEEVDLGLALTNAAIEQAPNSLLFTSFETAWIDQFRLQFPDQRSPQSDLQW